jgi:uncharacterized membrane protein
MGLNNKFKRSIAITILYVVLLALPIFEKVQHIVLYYAFVILLILVTIYRIIWDENFDGRFYNRWQKARQHGFWINVVREGLRSLALMIALVSTGQFIGNGRTPLEIVSKLSGSALVWISLFLLAFNLVIGIIAWYENNKRYKRIYYALKNNSK